MGRTARQSSIRKFSFFMYGLSNIDNTVNTLSERSKKEFRINGEHEAYVSFACNGEIKPI